jgi:hypothetical protein
MSATPLGLVLNPSARISVHDDEHPPSFLVEAPMKGASLSCVKVSAENLPGAHTFLRSILIDGLQNVQVGEQEAAELRQIGLFATAEEMPQTVAYQFPLRDSAYPGTLPSRSSNDDPAGHAARLPSHLRVPSEWSEQGLQFEPHFHGSVWAPVRVSNDAEPDIRRDHERAKDFRTEAFLDSEVTRTHFEREGFAILENLLPTDHVEELGRYFKALAAQGFLPLSDEHGSRRHYAHNHPVANFWHDQLNERVSQLAGRRTKPSYSFASLYVAGGDLFWHTDRPPCEYTVTLLLDYTPLNADGRSPWALKLTGRDGTIRSVHQRIGEALILKGRELKHGRDALADGHSSASLLFHFVNDDYDGVLE